MAEIVLKLSSRRAGNCNYEARVPLDPNHSTDGQSAAVLKKEQEFEHLFVKAGGTPQMATSIW
jgi:hypothetical protein